MDKVGDKVRNLNIKCLSKQGDAFGNGQVRIFFAFIFGSDVTGVTNI
jgi:hypothetical protein